MIVVWSSEREGKGLWRWKGRRKLAESVLQGSEEGWTRCLLDCDVFMELHGLLVIHVNPRPCR